jgi:hypothetical protein
MADVVYMDEFGFNLHLTRRFGRARRGQRCQQIGLTQRGLNLSLLIAIGCEGVTAHDVALGTYNIDNFLEFIQSKVNPSLDIQRFILMDNALFYRSREV